MTPNKYPVLDVNSLIPKCFMKEYDKDSDPATDACYLFQPVVTDMGICPSYNPTPMAELFEQSHYIKSSLNSYAEDFVANYTHCLGSLAWIKKSSLSNDYYSTQNYAKSK